MSQTIIHTLVALNLPKPIGLLINVVRTILLAIAGNAHFPSPNPPLATVDAAVSELQKAQAAVEARVKGAKEARDAKRAALVQLVKALATYVQGVADATPADAAAIIQSAAMGVHKVGGHGKRPFAATQGLASGSVTLVAPSAARRASYEWQWSADGGKTWQSAPATFKARASLAGLVAGVVHSFRYRANTKAGDGEWSQAIALLVR